MDTKKGRTTEVILPCGLFRIVQKLFLTDFFQIVKVFHDVIQRFSFRIAASNTLPDDVWNFVHLVS